MIDGKRYYKNANGRWVKDNVSQEEADRRASGSSGRGSVGNLHYRTRSADWSAPSSRARHATRSISSSSKGALPWIVMLFIVVFSLGIGAYFFNKDHVSTAEMAIMKYMDNQQQETTGVQEESVEITDVSAPTLEAISDDTEGYYIIKDSSVRYLDGSEIQNYSTEELQLIINEIYARHGREFQHQNNIDYFSSMPWYNPIPGKSDQEIENEFNDYERANVALLNQYQNS